ncbi:hypothetical protein ACQ4PT_014492 [Festuca glaucescens]
MAAPQFGAALLTVLLALATLASCNTEDLGNAGLSGTLVAELGGLKNLQYLRLYGNNLTGHIPATLGRLTKLRNLELQENALSGSIPASLGNITTLQYLRLYGNMLTGTVPLEILSLVIVGDLAELNVRRNNLAGTVTSSKQRVSNIIQDTLKTAN